MTKTNSSPQDQRSKKSVTPMSKRMHLAKILDRELTKSDIDPRSKLSILDMLRQGVAAELETSGTGDLIRYSSNQAQDRAERFG
jgi:hypothetical protein